MFSLLKAALRQRPNLIVIGEIRGEEGAIAFQAMQTGHAVMATFHASTVEKLIQRMTGNPINVPKAYVDNLNVVVIASDIRQLEHIEYTPAPDIIHEGAGHAPIIANPEYAEYLRRSGEIGCKAISSAKDHEIYEAIRHLSIINEVDSLA